MIDPRTVTHPLVCPVCGKAMTDALGVTLVDIQVGHDFRCADHPADAPPHASAADTPSVEAMEREARRQRACQEEPRTWLIYDERLGLFWGLQDGLSSSLAGARLYTQTEARRLSSDPSRRDRMEHVTQYRASIEEMERGAQRLRAALAAADVSVVVQPQLDRNEGDR